MSQNYVIAKIFCNVIILCETRYTIYLSNAFFIFYILTSLKLRCITISGALTLRYGLIGSVLFFLSVT